MFAGTGNINIEWNQKTITLANADFGAGLQTSLSYLFHGSESKNEVHFYANNHGFLYPQWSFFVKLTFSLLFGSIRLFFFIKVCTYRVSFKGKFCVKQNGVLPFVYMVLYNFTLTFSYFTKNMSLCQSNINEIKQTSAGL